jgi:hypothetical protein
VNSSTQSPSGLDQRWDYPHPHVVFTQVQANDIDGLQHTNNAVYVSSGRPRRLPQEFIDGYGPAVLGAVPSP